MRPVALGFAAILLVAAISLPATTADSGGAILGSYESDRCVGFAFIAFLPYTVVQPHVPSGYVAYYIPLVAQTHLEVYTCAEVTIGSTTESNVTIAVVGTATLHAMYRWETFISEPSPNAVQGLLEDAGWPVQQATFTKTLAGLEVQADGTTYTLTTSPQQLGNPTRTDDSYVKAIHHVTPDGDLLVLDEVFNTGTQSLYPGVLQAEGGVWQDIVGAPGVPVPGIVQEVDSILRVDVHEAV